MKRIFSIICALSIVYCALLNGQVITSVMDAPYTNISHNGVYSYGNYEDVAFYYNAETEFKLALQGDNLDDGGCWVWDINDLGQLAVEHKKRAALWTEANGYEYLPMPEGYNERTYSAARCITNDGKTVVVSVGSPTEEIYIYTLEEDNTYSVIDGQQRITSLVRYLKNEFALNGLQELNELNGKFYKDLPKDIQKKLKSSSLSTISLLKQSTNLKYEIFARLNQGAVKLNPQELRNCIYRGTFNKMLDDIAATNPHLHILFHDDNNRKSYQERILRFFALRNYQDYQSSMLKTMNSYMEQHRNDGEDEIKAAKEKFNSTIDIIKQVLGDNAFMAFDRNKNTKRRKKDRYFGLCVL